MFRMILVLASAVLVAATGDVLAQTSAQTNTQPPQKADLAPKAPEVIEGLARALDGRIIMFGERRVRLFGLGAPKMDDPRGPLSRAALDDLVSGATVACAVIGTDRRQRPVARCRAGGRDLAEAMIRDGWAYSRRQRTAEYDAAEAEARARGRGFWKTDDGDAMPERLWNMTLVLLGGLLAVAGGWMAQDHLARKDLQQRRLAVANGIGSELAFIYLLLKEALEEEPTLRTEELADLGQHTNRYREMAANVSLLPPAIVSPIDGFYGSLRRAATRAERLSRQKSTIPEIAIHELMEMNLTCGKLILDYHDHGIVPPDDA